MTWMELADQLAEELALIDDSDVKAKNQAYIQFQEKVVELGLRYPTILQKSR